MKLHETIDLGDDWFAVKVPMFSGPHEIRINHKCGEFDKWGKTSAVVHPMQKNTHKIRGVSYRCHNCKTPAPKKVLLFLKLHKLHEKVT